MLANGSSTEPHTALSALCSFHQAHCWVRQFLWCLWICCVCAVSSSLCSAHKCPWNSGLLSCPLSLWDTQALWALWDLWQLVQLFGQWLPPQSICCPEQFPRLSIFTLQICLGFDKINAKKKKPIKQKKPQDCYEQWVGVWDVCVCYQGEKDRSWQQQTALCVMLTGMITFGKSQVICPATTSVIT